MEDHGEVVDWLELVCMCAIALRPLQECSRWEEGCFGGTTNKALQCTTQPKQLACARVRSNSKAKHSKNQTNQDQ